MRRFFLLVAVPLLLSLGFCTPRFIPAFAECSTLSCLEVKTDGASGDVIATMTRRTLASVHREVNSGIRLLPPRVYDPPGRCIPPAEIASICTVNQPVEIRKPPTLRVETIRDHVPALSLVVQPVSGVVAIDFNLYLTPQPTDFRFPIAGFVLQIHLVPSIEWSFGDGRKLATVLMGAPYPVGTTRVAYRYAGQYLLRAHIAWSVSAKTSTGEEIEVTGSPITQTLWQYLTVRDAQRHLISTAR